MTARRKQKKRRLADRYRFYLIYGVGGLLLLLFVGYVYDRGGFEAVYRLRAIGLGAATGFLLRLFVSSRPRWFWIAFWLAVPVASPVLAVFYEEWGLNPEGWIRGLGIGAIAAGPIVAFRKRRRARLHPPGRVLLVPRGQRLSRPVSSRLTLTGFREALSGMDGKLQCVLTLVKSDARLNVFGDPSARMVVYYTPDLDDDFRWQRAVSPEVENPDHDVEVPVGGGITGTYRRASTTTVDVARRAGEYFIRNGGPDPELTWEGGSDVCDRLPPTQLAAPPP